MTTRTIVWFRGKDLRLADHAPLASALQDDEVIPLFVLDPFFFTKARAADCPHRMQFLLDSLHALADALAARGSKLIAVRGKSSELVPRIFEQWRADRLVAQRWVEPFARERDLRIRKAIGSRFELFEGETLLPPGTLRTAGGTPYGVFGHFSRALRRELCVDSPLKAPARLPPLPPALEDTGSALPSPKDLGLTPNPNILAGGEQAAHKRLRRFVRDRAAGYAEQRDRMDLEGTSRLSADLKFGTLSPRQVWSAVRKACPTGAAPEAFLNELVWREFTHSTLWDRPELLDSPFRPAFRNFPWRSDAAAWQAWVSGRTGYPTVDAAARQLLGEGFVHNRARMLAASFLTKHLLLDYRKGEAHYLKYLTDGDWAQNNAGWQWSAGCGTDAQPYFRIFNPVTQGKKFDPEGNYVRRWVPELSKLPARYIHCPFEAPSSVLEAAGVRLGETYPAPIVDHRAARERFLATASSHLKPESGVRALSG